MRYPSGDTANGFVANVCGLPNITWLVEVEGPSVQKEKMLTKPKVQNARLNVQNIDGIE